MNLLNNSFSQKEKDIKYYIDSEAFEYIKKSIKNADNNEVFFACYLANSKIVKAEVLSRGNKFAVPAILNKAIHADVVVHNHPSSNLTPSHADLNIAAYLADYNTGFYIVDNSLEHLYIVVEHFAKKEPVLLDIETLIKLLFSKEARTYIKNFEVRPQQTEMLKLVAQSLNNCSHLMVEAGTGVGKTFAYLIPAVYWAHLNSEKVIISTRTINLQEQIYYKDLPVLKKILPFDFNYELSKGRSNYLCLKKLENLVPQLEIFESYESDTLIKILNWAQKTTTGDISELTFIPDENIKREICSEPELCLKVRCPLFSKCFVYESRRNLVAADIIITNHALLFSDLFIKHLIKKDGFGILPGFKRVIIDEAHHIEDIATENFGSKTSYLGIKRILSQFYNQKRPSVLMQILHNKKLSKNKTILKKLNSLIKKISSLQKFVDSKFNKLNKILLKNFKEESITLRVTYDTFKEKWFKEKFVKTLNSLLTKLSGLYNELGNLSKLISNFLSIKSESFKISNNCEWALKLLNSRIIRFKEAIAILSCFIEFESEDLDYVYFVEKSKNKVFRFRKLPINIGPLLNEIVFSKLKSTILTSATLTVDKKFDFIVQRLGIENSENFLFNSFTSPFDYKSRVLLGVSTDIDHTKLFTEKSINSMSQILKITHGNAFILSTSFQTLNKLYDLLFPLLVNYGINCLKQGELPRMKLIQQFKENKNSVLFATDSFWEGVDVPGKDLICLILTKLPFKVPTDPLIVARAEKLKKEGKNPFMDYYVPLAVLKFKQGFGRLIRKKTDFGAVIIFDNRILKQNYGKKFLNSLPDINRAFETSEELIKVLAKFYEKFLN